MSFSKRKKTLFEDAKKFATQIGANVGVMLFSPGGKPYSYGFTSKDEITHNFFNLKLEDRQGEGAHADVGKSNVFEAFKEKGRLWSLCN